MATASILPTSFNPSWNVVVDVIVRAHDENKPYITPPDRRSFTISLNTAGIINYPNTYIWGGATSASQTSVQDIITNYICGYFKGINLNPDSTEIAYFSNTNNDAYQDLQNYINQGLTNTTFPEGIAKDESTIILGELTTSNQADYSIIYTQYQKKYLNNG